jgi:hypothetical protein
MARRFRKIPSVRAVSSGNQAAGVRDLRNAPGNGEVSVEPASETTNDGPELTESSVAPEASPAQTKSTGTRKGSTKRKAPAKK